MSRMQPQAELWLWRHPRPQGAAGRCIGRTDLPVDARRAKRLAHRIRKLARRQGLPRVVWTSPLRRCAAVGRWLARWGWQHHIDARLLELDFGRWEGRAWADIGWQEVQAWEAHFASHAPGGGESLAAMALRLADWRAALPPSATLVVAHAGAMNLLRCGDAPLPQAADWPPAPGYGRLLRLQAAQGAGPAGGLTQVFSIRPMSHQRRTWQALHLGERAVQT